MPYIRLFQAAFGRLRGKLCLAPPGAASTSDALMRVGRLGLVLTGVVLIGSITVVAKDSQWLGAITVGAAANNNCDDNGDAQGCFFTPEKDTGTPLASLKGVKVPQDEKQLKVGGDFIANQDEVVIGGRAVHQQANLLPDA